MHCDLIHRIQAQSPRTEMLECSTKRHSVSMPWGCAWTMMRPVVQFQRAGTVASRDVTQQRANCRNRRAIATIAAAESAAIASQRWQKFDLLRSRSEEIVQLKRFQTLDSWDQSVNMPPVAATSRAKQSSALAGVLHEKQTDPSLGELLKSLDMDEEYLKQELSVEELALWRETKKSYRLATSLNKDVKAREAGLTAKAEAAWRVAKAKNDFGLFAPFLQEWVDLKREVAKAIDPNKPMYDVLLDEFERGITCADLDEIIAEIKPVIVDLVSRTTQATQNPDVYKKFDLTRFDGCYDLDEQEKLGKKLALALGFKGLVNIGPHPCTLDICPTDVRVTTRYNKKELLEGILSLTHECGHAFHAEAGRGEFEDMPYAQLAGLNEAQALLWEWQMSRRLEFWEYFWPILRSHFPTLPDVAPHVFHAAMNRVAPSHIRVDADEVTYPLHIILRYEMEQGLIDGSIKVNDVPATWNSKMQEYLGIVPENDSEGCLQDIHWSLGAFGYFPAYLVGAMCGAQLFRATAQANPNLCDDFRTGKFDRFREWLKVNVHKPAFFVNCTDDLMKQVCGAGLDPKVYISYLTGKYEALYRL